MNTDTISVHRNNSFPTLPLGLGDRWQTGSEQPLQLLSDVSPVPILTSPIRFRARDGYALNGVLFRNSSAAAPVGTVVFNTGGGVGLDRYTRFLKFLAKHNLLVLAYDYRGVGRSSVFPRRRLTAGVEDWAELDQTAAIEYAGTLFSNCRITSVSHSIGCMVAAAASNANLVEQMVFISPHSGYWKDYRSPYKWPMALLWHLLMPVTAQVLGYFPASWFGLGDDFPKRVALQWAARLSPQIRFGAYGGDAYREFGVADRMSRLTNKALVIGIEDDCFATDAAIRRFLMSMPQLKSVRRDLGGKTGHELRLGHWGFFRRYSFSHWHIVARFICAPVPTFNVDPSWLNDRL